MELLTGNTVDMSHKILVVEDEGLVALDICNQLGDLGYSEVKTERRADRALQLIKDFRPDLALLDIKIEGDMDGVELAERLRSETDTPVIFLTAFADAETIERAKHIEPYGYLLKPVDHRELHTAVEMALYRHNMQRERKRAEEENKLLERRLLQAKKMEAIGTLSAGLAHELNNTLMGIIGNIDLACNCSVIAPQNKRRLALALDGCDRAARLLQQLLGFARQGKYQPEPLQLKQQLAATLDFLAPILEKNISVSFPHLGPDYWITADRQQFDQVVTNLAINAQQAMPQGGKIEFQVDRKFLEHPQANNAQAAPGYFVALEVSDTGHGMSQELMTQIFEPFFSTKLRCEGTGLGLSVVYGVMQHHGGWVEVKSKPGAGSCFTLWFPEIQPDTAQRRKAGNLKIAPGPCTGTVMVLDDEPVISNVLSEYLERYGFSPVAFNDPERALNWYAEHARDVDLVLLDMKIPGKSGAECFKEIRRINSHAVCFLLSGHIRDHTVNELLATGATGFFAKPLDFDKMIRTLSQYSAQREHALRH